MSYIRAGHKMLYVEGESDDYIFPCQVSEDSIIYIEDYGGISNKGIVECIARILYRKNEDNLWNDYLIKHLAEKLNVELKKENYGEWNE